MKDTDEPLAEINVTPLVDVMLVLVVIFLVMAPLLTRTIPIDLPKVTASVSGSPDHSITVSLDAHGRIYVDGNEIASERLEPMLRHLASQDPGTTVNLRSDRKESFGTVANVLAEIRHAGIVRVAVVTADIIDPAE
jgi:biopolymer transport protein ExbD/biopolymer transport protein TolR